MRGVLIVTWQSVRLLMRDRVFIPATVICIMVALAANIASDWGVSEFRKILFDVGGFGFQALGIAIATLWGTKILYDSPDSGSLEVILTGPLRRGAWISAKFIALMCALVAVAVFFLVFWQGLMWLNDFETMTPVVITFFAFHMLAWMCVGAVGIFFSSFCTQPTALFATVTATVIGVVAEPISAAIAENADALARIVERVAALWDLQRLNLIDSVTVGAVYAPTELLARGAYGVCMTAFLLVAATVIFSQREFQ